MDKSNIVIVIGAGASCEVGLPVGSELKNKIIELLNLRYEYGVLKSGDQLIADALKKYTHQINAPDDYESYRVEAIKLCRALPLAISIDNALDAHSENEKN